MIMDSLTNKRNRKDAQNKRSMTSNLQIENQINVLVKNCYDKIQRIKPIDKMRLDKIYGLAQRTPLAQTIRARQLRCLCQALRPTDEEPIKICH